MSAAVFHLGATRANKHCWFCGGGVFRVHPRRGDAWCVGCGASRRQENATPAVHACGCGSILFVVTPRGVACANCSGATSFADLLKGVRP